MKKSLEEKVDEIRESQIRIEALISEKEKRISMLEESFSKIKWWIITVMGSIIVILYETFKGGTK